MSQHILYDKKGREWMVGFDNPCGGYYATRFVPEDDAETTGEEADVLIGFGRGVELKELILECGKCGLFLYEHGGIVETLIMDGIKERRPLTPLQEMVLGMANDAGVFDE